jgi:hypothetical protein
MTKTNKIKNKQTVLSPTNLAQKPFAVLQTLFFLFQFLLCLRLHIETKSVLFGGRLVCSEQTISQYCLLFVEVLGTGSGSC